MSPRINSKGRGGGGAPPPLKSIPVQLKSIPWGGGGHYWFYHFFLGGGGGGGGVKGPFLWYINSVPWPNQFWTHPYLCKQELQLCSSRARFRDISSANLQNHCRPQPSECHTDFINGGRWISVSSWPTKAKWLLFCPLWKLLSRTDQKLLPGTQFQSFRQLLGLWIFLKLRGFHECSTRKRTARLFFRCPHLARSGKRKTTDRPLGSRTEEGRLLPPQLLGELKPRRLWLMMASGEQKDIAGNEKPVKHKSRCNVLTYPHDKETPLMTMVRGLTKGWNLFYVVHLSAQI